METTNTTSAMVVNQAKETVMTATETAFQFFLTCEDMGPAFAEAALKENGGDVKKCRKAFTACIVAYKPDFKTNEKGTKEKRVYDRFRKQLELIELANKPVETVIDVTANPATGNEGTDNGTGEETAPAYDVNERFACILAEMTAHPELAEKLIKYFAGTV